MKISMNACRTGMHGVNDDTTLIFNDEQGNEVNVNISLEEAKKLLEALYLWTLVKHHDVDFMKKHAENIIRDFTEAQNSKSWFR